MGLFHAAILFSHHQSSQIIRVAPQHNFLGSACRWSPRYIRRTDGTYLELLLELFTVFFYICISHHMSMKSQNVLSMQCNTFDATFVYKLPYNIANRGFNPQLHQNAAEAATTYCIVARFRGDVRNNMV